jgi:hypothetical protein
MERALTKRQRHTSLATKIFGCPYCPVRKRDVDRLVGTVNDGFTENCPDLIRRSEKSYILSSEIRRETGYEHGRAHNLRVTGCMMR